MTDTIIMRGAYAITDPRLGAAGVIPAGAVVIIDGIAHTVDLTPFNPGRMSPFDPARLRMND